MINKEVLKEIEQLASIYKNNWGILLDYTIIPSGMSQERLVVVLRRIIDTGESILVGYNKMFLE